METTRPQVERFLMDSGSSDHIVQHEKVLEDLVEKSPREIVLENGSKVL